MGFWMILQVAALLATFAGIVWGVLGFFVPPTGRRWKGALLSIFALVGFVNQLFRAWHAPNVPARAAAATLIYAASMALFWSAVSAWARRRPTAIFGRDVPERVVTAAAYSVVRHPFYSAYSLFWIAGWVGSGAWSTAVVALTMFTLYVAAARGEEAEFAASPLGEAYRRYQQRTGFFVPRLPVLAGPLRWRVR